MGPSQYRKIHQESAPTRNSCWNVTADYLSLRWSMFDPRANPQGSSPEEAMAIFKKRLDECADLMKVAHNFPGNTREELAKLPLPSDKEAVETIKHQARNPKEFERLESNYFFHSQRALQCVASDSNADVKNGDVAAWNKTNDCIEKYRRAAKAIGEYVEKADLSSLVFENMTSNPSRRF